MQVYAAAPGSTWDTERIQAGCLEACWTGKKITLCRARGGKGCEHPGIVTAALTHQQFNQPDALFIFALELLNT